MSTRIRAEFTVQLIIRDVRPRLRLTSKLIVFNLDHCATCILLVLPLTHDIYMILRNWMNPESLKWVNL